MTKLNFLLLLVVIASALVLVKSAYDVRRLTSEIHRAEMEAQRLAGRDRDLAERLHVGVGGDALLEHRLDNSGVHRVGGRGACTEHFHTPLAQVREICSRHLRAASVVHANKKYRGLVGHAFTVAKPSKREVKKRVTSRPPASIAN